MTDVNNDPLKLADAYSIVNLRAGLVVETLGSGNHRLGAQRGRRELHQHHRRRGRPAWPHGRLLQRALHLGYQSAQELPLRARRDRRAGAAVCGLLFTSAAEYLVRSFVAGCEKPAQPLPTVTRAGLAGAGPFALIPFRPLLCCVAQVPARDFSRSINQRSALPRLSFRHSR
jgi:hypothetical protein